MNREYQKLSTLLYVEQYERLRLLAFNRRSSINELIRQAIEIAFPEGGPEPEEKEKEMSHGERTANLYRN